MYAGVPMASPLPVVVTPVLPDDPSSSARDAAVSAFATPKSVTIA